jgi:hypothetical protein
MKIGLPIYTCGRPIWFFADDDDVSLSVSRSGHQLIISVSLPLVIKPFPHSVDLIVSAAGDRS